MTKRHYHAPTPPQRMNPQNKRRTKQTLFYLFVFIGFSLGITAFILYFVKRKCSSSNNEKFKITTSHETLTSDQIDCSKLPDSINGAKYSRGCPGAVWSNGNASKTYCDGNNGNKNKTYQWYAACCQWDDKKCVAKNDKIYELCWGPQYTGNEDITAAKMVDGQVSSKKCGRLSNTSQILQSQDEKWLESYKNWMNDLGLTSFQDLINVWHQALQDENNHVAEGQNPTSDIIRKWDLWHYVKNSIPKNNELTKSTYDFMEELAGLQS